MIAKKCFGQNYLENPYVLEQIIEAMSLQSNDRVLEVGPGPSYLTRMIVPHVGSYFAIEIDCQFTSILESIEREYTNFHYVIDDFLKVPARTFSSCNKFVGNLPYHISSPILYRIASETPIDTLVCMFASGTADRFLAGPGSPNYSAGSIMAQSFFSVEKILSVPRTQFKPVPKVDSMVLRFKRKKGNQQSTIAFNDWIQPFFSYRRKTIFNAFLQNHVPRDIANLILQKADIKPTERIENLSIEKLWEMFTLYQNEET